MFHSLYCTVRALKLKGCVLRLYMLAFLPWLISEVSVAKATGYVALFSIKAEINVNADLTSSLGADDCCFSKGM